MNKLLFILFALFAVIGCQKNELKISSDLDCTEQTSTNRDGNAPVVQVVDSTLVFQSLEQYNSVRAWVENASKEELMAWQQNIGFRSVRYYYEEALGQQCCPDEEGNIEQIAAQYAGKVLYNAEEKDINPLLPYVVTGWLVNRQGDFKLGNSRIRYTPDHVISVVDGNPAKLEAATINPVQNIETGVYVHPTVGERGGCCPWQLPLSSVSTGNSNGSRRIKTAWVTNWDESFAAYVENMGTIYNVIFTFAGYFHHQRKTWLGWTVCQRTQWKHNSGETARIVNLPPNCPCIPLGFVNPKVIDINTTTANECKVNFEKTIFAALAVTPEIYHTLGLCVEKIYCTTKALESGLVTSNQCQ